MATTSLTDIEAEIGTSVTDSPAAGGQAPATGSSGGPSSAKARKYEDGALTVVPAGFIADILGGLSGTIGEVTGGFFGNAPLGKQIGKAAQPLVELLPFTLVAPSLMPASTGPGGAGKVPEEAMIVVPNAFLGGILGGIGGNLLGSTVGGWLGDSETGADVGSAVGGFLGGLLPFQVVPPELMPASAGPDAKAPTSDEAMVVVPAGFFGNLLSGVASTFSGIDRGIAGDVAGAASPFLKMIPFQAVPKELAPMTAGPGGASKEIEMTVLPAGFFGSLLSGMAESVGGAVGGLFGGERVGAQIGSTVAPIINMLPFHAVPPVALAPQSAGPAGAPQEQMLFVPAGLFGSLLSGWGGTLNSLVSDWSGSPNAGKVAEGLTGIVGDLLPFSVLPDHA